jgi:beta-glucosidase
MAGKTLTEHHDHSSLIFPEGFLWGAATSAFQVEGQIVDSDWWKWEQHGLPENFRSGKAADQYNRYKEDFTLAKDLGHNSTRLGIEWSRIEPKEGKFDQAQIDHYIEELKYLKEQGFTVMLTLHHFTNPAWFAEIGGWENSKAAFYFERYVKTIVPLLKNYVDLWITINEPAVYTYLAYITLDFPPQKKSNFAAVKVYWHMAKAHQRAYKAIHSIIPQARVGYANSIQSFTKLHLHSFRETMAEWLGDIFTNHTFYMLTGLNTHDFIALNYYTNIYITTKEGKFLPIKMETVEAKKEVSDLGWEIHPEGMFDILMDMSSLKKPIYITENGIASTNDDRRVRFLISFLKEIYHATVTGADVRGYFYWSLIDNMELHRGFEPRFGLIEIDFKTQKRTPRPSAYIYKRIIADNGIEHDLLKFLGHRVKVEEVLK